MEAAMKKTISPEQLESTQAYNFVFDHTKRYFQFEENQVKCIDCEAIIPACDQDVSGLCIDCWLEDHPIN